MNTLSKIETTEIEHLIGKEIERDREKLRPRTGKWTVVGPTSLHIVIILPHTPQVLQVTTTTVHVICSEWDIICVRTELALLR